MAEVDDMHTMPVDIRQFSRVSYASRSAATVNAAALDIWLQKTLSARYDSTLDEDLPTELTSLLTGVH